MRREIDFTQIVIRNIENAPFTQDELKNVVKQFASMFHSAAKTVDDIELAKEINKFGVVKMSEEEAKRFIAACKEAKTVFWLINPIEAYIQGEFKKSLKEIEKESSAKEIKED